MQTLSLQGGLVIVAAAYGRPAAVAMLLADICRGDTGAPDTGAAAAEEVSGSAASPDGEQTPANGSAGAADDSGPHERCTVLWLDFPHIL